MAWELLDIRDELRFPTLSCSAAHAFPKGYGLACYFALEWAEDELVRCC